MYNEKPKNKNKNDVLVMEKGSLGARIVAIWIDGFILGFITSVLVGFTGTWAGGGMSMLIGLGYNWFFWTRYDGQTPGKMAMGLRVVKTSGASLNDVDAAIRYLGYYVNTFFFGLGWLWAFVDKDGQGFHDKLAGTIVVRAIGKTGSEISA